MEACPASPLPQARPTQGHPDTAMPRQEPPAPQPPARDPARWLAPIGEANRILKQSQDSLCGSPDASDPFSTDLSNRTSARSPFKFWWVLQKCVSKEVRLFCFCYIWKESSFSFKLQSLFSNESYFAKEIRKLYPTWEEWLVLKKQLTLASRVGPGQASPLELSGSISLRHICFPDKLGSPVVNWLTLQI